MTDPTSPEHPTPTPTPTLTVTSKLDDVCAELRRVGPDVRITLAGRAAEWSYSIKLCDPPDVTPEGTSIARRDVKIVIGVAVDAAGWSMVPHDQRMLHIVLGESVGAGWGEHDGQLRRRSKAVEDRTLSLAVAPGLAELADIDEFIFQHQAARAMAVAAEEARYAAALAH